MGPRLPPGALVDATISLGVALGMREWVVDGRYIPSLSMQPTFDAGDYLILDKISTRLRAPARGDVVCFSPPAALASQARGRACVIKRVVAVQGDRVQVRRGRLEVNGRPVDEPYVLEPMTYSLRPRVVPAGHLFVLGDNRNHSYDSHEWGPLPATLILGRPLCTYWPPDRWCGRGAYGLSTSERAKRTAFPPPRVAKLFARAPGRVHWPHDGLKWRGPVRARAAVAAGSS